MHSWVEVMFPPIIIPWAGVVAEDFEWRRKYDRKLGQGYVHSAFAITREYIQSW